MTVSDAYSRVEEIRKMDDVEALNAEMELLYEFMLYVSQLPPPRHEYQSMRSRYEEHGATCFAVAQTLAEELQK